MKRRNRDIKYKSDFNKIHCYISLFLFFAGILLFPQTIFANGTEEIIINVFINMEEKGNYFILVAEDEDVLFLKSDLEELALVLSDKNIEVNSEGYISLNSLAPKVKFEINIKDSAIYVTTTSEFLKKNSIDLSLKEDKVSEVSDVNSGFINYGFNTHLDKNLSSTNYSIPLETGIKLGRFFLDSKFSHTKSTADEKTVRLMANITTDDKNAATRYKLGDFSANSGNLGSGGTYGGLSITKNFTITPYFKRSPELELTGVLETPSEVKLYVNDTLIRTEEFSAGEFSFINVPSHAGDGEAEIVIKDAFGKEKRMLIPFILSSKLLKVGVSEYSYNIGYEREKLGNESDRYDDDLIFVGFHKIGVTKKFTVGIRAEARNAVNNDKSAEYYKGDMINYGASAVLLFDQAGEFDASFALSNEKDAENYKRNGYATSLNYSVNVDQVHSGFSIRTTSKEYSNLSTSATAQKSRYSGSVNIGISHDYLGSLNTSYSMSETYDDNKTTRNSLSYSNQFFEKLSTRISWSKVENEEGTSEEVMLFASMNFQVSNNTNGSLRYDYSDKTYVSGLSASLNKSAPTGTGYGYKVETDTVRHSFGREDYDTDLNSSFDVRWPYGDYALSYSRRSDNDSYNFRATGALTLINGIIYPAKQVNDSFGMVKVANLEGVKVMVGSQEMQKTNSDGIAVVPNLISYYNNAISIEPLDLPINYNIPNDKKYVTTSYRGGAFIEFYVTKLQAFEGNILYIIDGKKVPAEYAGLAFEYGDGKKIEAIVGEEGYFYFENVPAGTYPARVWDNKRECNFNIVIPGSDDIMVDIGEITCEIN
ncbi:fimbria/pilus outer membrane usher protein [Thermodesulfobacteriota bacterium]